MSVAAKPAAGYGSWRKGQVDGAAPASLGAEVRLASSLAPKAPSLAEQGDGLSQNDKDQRQDHQPPPLDNEGDKKDKPQGANR